MLQLTAKNQKKIEAEVTNTVQVEVTNQSSSPSPVYFSDTGSLDAFSRLRVSGPEGYRVDSTFTYDKQPLLFDEQIGGAGSATFDSNLRAVYLSTVGTADADEACLRLHYHAPYTPGNSQLVILTGTLNPDNDAVWTNAKSEIGYGTSLNAVGFRYSEIGGTPQASIFIRSSISGAPSDLVEVKQSLWNKNTAAGVDWSKSQIFIIDFQSLAVGRIRFYLDRNGQAVLIHEVYNDNVRVGPYWQNASLPPYWKVENTGIATKAHRVLAVCCTVKSEGGVPLGDIPGFPFSASNTNAPKNVSSTLVPVLSIQLKTLFAGVNNRGLVVPLDVQLMGTNPAHYQIILNASLTNSAFASVGANSLCNFDTAATVVSGGIVITSGFLSGAGGGARGLTGVGLTGRVPLAVNAAGSAGDILTIAAIRVGTNDSGISAAINWKEIR